VEDITSMVLKNMSNMENWRLIRFAVVSKKNLVTRHYEAIQDENIVHSLLSKPVGGQETAEHFPSAVLKGCRGLQIKYSEYLQPIVKKSCTAI